MLATPALKGSRLKAIVKTISNVTSINHLKSGTAMCSSCSHSVLYLRIPCDPYNKQQYLSTQRSLMSL